MIKKIVEKILPSQLVDTLKKIKYALKDFTPLKVTGPVVQIYIEDGETESFIGINDFYTFLLPEETFSSLLKLIFYDEDGKKILERREQLGVLLTTSISISKLFKESRIVSSHGIVTLEMKPIKIRNKALRRLGPSASHFFMFYKAKSGSLGHIHPSSILTKENVQSGEFVSNQSIASINLKKIILYQANPSYHEVEIEHEVLNAEGDPSTALLNLKNSMPPLSVRKIEFDLTKINNINFYHIRVFPLPTSNSKPMIMRVFGNNVYSVSHS